MSELSEIQRLIVETRTKRGFTKDPLKIYILLSEEIGEIAAELKKTWSSNYDPFDTEKLQDEIADSFVLLSALASEYGINLEDSIRKKFLEKDSQRVWKTAEKSLSMK